MTTIGTLPRMSASTLSALVLSQSPSSNPSVAVIDVRDDDHIGGHILGSTHIPSATIDYKISGLVHKLRDKDTVVFHCALSQQRGPSAALRYMRERERLLGAFQLKVGEEVKAGEKEGEEGEGTTGVKEQKVYVLENGFVGWQELYGEDERLTEGYRKDLWKDGYCF